MKELIEFNDPRLIRLKKIELKAWKYIRTLKTWNLESVVIKVLREQWTNEAEKLGILGPYLESVHVLENGKKYSYTFGDCLA